MFGLGSVVVKIEMLLDNCHPSWGGSFPVFSSGHVSAPYKARRNSQRHRRWPRARGSAASRSLRSDKRRNSAR